MARPKEEVRQNKAMRSILRGETPEKRIMVGFESKDEKPTGDKIDRLSDISRRPVCLVPSPEIEFRLPYLKALPSIVVIEFAL